MVYKPFHSYSGDDEEDMVWVVYHSDKSVCEAVMEADRIRFEKARNKQQASRNLYDLAVKPENMPPGTNLKVQGERIVVDDKAIAYGGGSWVVIEPNGRYFWYVVNNGADGDDWSQNNVETGGAGGIGYRLELTPEAKVLIEAATEGKTKLAARVVRHFQAACLPAHLPH